MSLLVWLPLNGNLENKGCSNAVATAVTTAGYSDGKLGKALSSGKIKIDAKYVPNIFNNTAMSICFWYNNNGTTSSHPICGFSGNNGDGDSGAVRSWDFFNYSTVNNFHWSMGTLGNGILSNVIPNNTWVHFCITFKTGSLKIYINGEQSYSSTSSTSSFTFDKSYYISFGYTQMLNDFRIYDECLSKEQIHQISQGLILHYPLNSGYGNENLLIGTNKFNNGGNASGITSSTTEDNLLKVVATKNNGNWKQFVLGNGNETILQNTMNVGDKFVVSFDMKIESGSGIPSLFINAGNGYQQMIGDANLIGTWQRVYQIRTWKEPRYNLWIFIFPFRIWWIRRYILF